MSVLGHVFEDAGLTTVAIALVREHAERVKPPRALFVPFQYGYPLGKPNDPEYQHRVIAAALKLVEQSTGPVLMDYPVDVNGVAIHESLVQASAVQPAPVVEDKSSADEITALRAFYERWVADHEGRTAVGLSGIPQRRFRGIIRFLEAFGSDTSADMKERPTDVSVLQFLRYCVDDLKAFCYEARMSQRPKATEAELHTWFWGETATGRLIASIAQRMNDTDDAEFKSFAFGVAR